MQRSFFDPVEDLDQQVRTGFGQSSEQIAGSVRRPDRLGHNAEHRAGVHARLQLEDRSSGDIVAAHDGALDGRRTPPCRQQREVQVYPAVGRDVQHGLRDQSAVGDDRAAIRLQFPQCLHELGVAGLGRRQDRDPTFGSRPTHRAGSEPAPASGHSIRAGDHRDHLMAGGKHRLQTDHGDLGRAREDHPHRPLR